MRKPKKVKDVLTDEQLKELVSQNLRPWIFSIFQHVFRIERLFQEMQEIIGLPISPGEKRWRLDNLKAQTKKYLEDANASILRTPCEISKSIDTIFLPLKKVKPFSIRNIRLFAEVFLEAYREALEKNNQESTLPWLTDEDIRYLTSVAISIYLERWLTPYDDQVPAFYTTYHCEAENVREALAPEVDYWTARDPTLICAPPGMGKTTLACEELLPRALSAGRNILFLVNRVVLATQLKRKVLGLIDPEVSEYLSEKGLRKLDRYKNICVLTYHSLPAFIKRPENAEWVRNVQYVVADEIHVVTSDSSFNYFCGYYLKLLTQKFQHAIRVYMTATEWDMLLPLAYAEKQNYLDAMRLVDPFLGPRKFIRYHFSTDYRRHIDLHFFSGMEDILQRIDERPSERWILFMASKKEGRELAKQLKGRAVYLDADSKDTDAWAKLLQNSRYGEQVLITTAVLDCGVNIIDPTVRNLVIFTDDRTQLIQMMGRKRFSHPDERVNLFVYDIDEKTVSRRYQEGEALCQLLERYEQSRSEDCAKMAQEFWLNQQEPSLRHYFGLSNGHLLPNEVAFFALKRKMNFYRALLEGNMTFQEAVRGWLGLPKAHEEGHGLEAKLEAFCEAHLNQDLTEEEISYFRDMVVRVADQVGSIKTRPDRLDSIGREALNKRIGTFMCPYRLARGAWRIERAVEATEA